MEIAILYRLVNLHRQEGDLKKTATFDGSKDTFERIGFCPLS